VTDRHGGLEQAGRLAGIVFTVVGAAAALVWARFVYDALSGSKRFSRPFDIVLYLVAPAVLAVACFGARRLTAVQKLRLLLSGATAVASLYALELFVIMTTANAAQRVSAFDYQLQIQPPMVRLGSARNKEKFAAQLEKEFGVHVDVRQAADVLADWKTRGIDAVPIITATNHLLVRQPDGSLRSRISLDGREVIPLSSIANRVTLLCNESGQWIHIQTDSRGFNNPEDAWTTRPLEIAAVGDSFAHGYCVPGGKSFMDLIRQRAGATLNLGIAGDGPLTMLATLKEYLPPLRPKTVLWFYFEGNDLVDLQTERKSALLRKYLQPGFSQPALERQIDIDRAITAEIPALQQRDQLNLDVEAGNRIRYAVRSFLKVTALRNRLSPLVASDPETQAAAADYETTNLQVFREILTEARTDVASWNGALYFVYLPEWARYTSFTSWGKEKRAEVLRIVGDLGIPLIDIDPVFRAQGDPLRLFPFRSSSHYSEEGHRLVAEEVLRRLAALGGPPGSPTQR
jgi:hypothetical protein